MNRSLTYHTQVVGFITVRVTECGPASCEQVRWQLKLAGWHVLRPCEFPGARKTIPSTNIGLGYEAMWYLIWASVYQRRLEPEICSTEFQGSKERLGIA
jgi:hypothetical protein